jgi:hypothetical protein
MARHQWPGLLNVLNGLSEINLGYGPMWPPVSGALDRNGWLREGADGGALRLVIIFCQLSLRSRP